MRISGIIVQIALAFDLLAASAAGTAAELRAHVINQSGKPVANAVVVVEPVVSVADRPANAASTAVMDQIDKQFAPFVLAIQVGTRVEFPNHDNILHHVYSFSPAKNFQLPLYSGSAAAPILFDKPGIVVLGCNIHDWMIGYVYVTESPYFGKTDSGGDATIAQLPMGSYVAHIWHPTMHNQEADT